MFCLNMWACNRWALCWLWLLLCFALLWFLLCFSLLCFCFCFALLLLCFALLCFALFCLALLCFLPVAEAPAADLPQVLPAELSADLAAALLAEMSFPPFPGFANFAELAGHGKYTANLHVCSAMPTSSFSTVALFFFLSSKLLLVFVKHENFKFSQRFPCARGDFVRDFVRGACPRRTGSAGITQARPISLAHRLLSLWVVLVLHPPSGLP